MGPNFLHESFLFRDGLLAEDLAGVRPVELAAEIARDRPDGEDSDQAGRPHSEMQWASSTTTRETPAPRADFLRSRQNSSERSLSGAASRMRTSPERTRTSASRLGVRLGHKPCHAGVPRGWREAAEARGQRVPSAVELAPSGAMWHRSAPTDVRRGEKMGRERRRKAKPPDDWQELLPLFALDEGGWLKALKLEGHAARQAPGPMALQEVLFPYLDAL